MTINLSEKTHTQVHSSCSVHTHLVQLGFRGQPLTSGPPGTAVLLNPAVALQTVHMSCTGGARQMRALPLLRCSLVLPVGRLPLTSAAGASSDPPFDAGLQLDFTSRPLLSSTPLSRPGGLAASQPLTPQGRLASRVWPRPLLRSPDGSVRLPG